MKDMNSPPIPAKAGIEAFGHPISGRGASGSPWVPASAGMSGDRAGMLESTLRHATPQRILRAALGAFGDRIALVSSFGSESAVLLHMASEIDPAIPVLFLDTGMQFGQTLDYRKQLVARLGLTDVRDLRPAFKDLAAIDPSGMLWKTDTDACCNLRKVVPLDTALEGFDAWITGRKRFQAITRASLPVVEEAGRLVKVNPLANWTKAELDTYVAEHDLPPHPLVAQGFPSIGCWPCTKPVEEGGDVRSGRWVGQDKTECGIHVERAHVIPPEFGGNI
jgi:phosphoadenosine phosphosulfate reductase